jgi:hypothetical protein
MKKSIFSAVVLLIVILPGGIVSGQSKETRDVRGFKSVGFGIAGELFIKTGPEYKLTMEGDRDVLEDIETVVRDGKLIIRKENWRLSFNNEMVTVNLTLPELESVGVAGSGNVQILDMIEADRLDFGVSGNGKLITSGLNVDRLECGISGSGDIILGSTGSIDRANISISGSGGFSGEGIEIDDLEVHISGSGNCRCRAGDNLEAYISGSGNITYSGNPKVDAKVSGSGHVRSK